MEDIPNNETQTINATQLTIGDIISNSFGLAIKNAGSILLIMLVYVLTIWIPYINLGTSIAMYAFVIAMARNEAFTVEELFSCKYRKLMGPMLLLFGMSFLAIVFGLLWMIIPGIVLMLAWGQASYLIVDKNLDPMEALKTSYKITYGKKWTIFLSGLILSLLFVIPDVLLEIWHNNQLESLMYGYGGYSNSTFWIYTIIGLAISITQMMVWFGFGGYVYNQLSKEL